MQTNQSLLEGADVLPPHLRTCFEGCIQSEPFRIARGRAEAVPDGGYLITLVADARLSIPLHLVLRNLVHFADDYHLTSLYVGYRPEAIELETQMLLTTNPSKSWPHSSNPTTEASEFVAASSGSTATPFIPSIPRLVTASPTKKKRSSAFYAASGGITDKVTVRQLNALYRALEENNLGPWLNDERFDALRVTDVLEESFYRHILEQGIGDCLDVVQYLQGMITRKVEALGFVVAIAA